MLNLNGSTSGGEHSRRDGVPERVEACPLDTRLSARGPQHAVVEMGRVVWSAGGLAKASSSPVRCLVFALSMSASSGEIGRSRRACADFSGPTTPDGQNVFVRYRVQMFSEELPRKDH